MRGRPQCNTVRRYHVERKQRNFASFELTCSCKNTNLQPKNKKSARFSLSFAESDVNLHLESRACGEIGRRARLRIWCSDTCRFESYQAHTTTALFCNNSEEGCCFCLSLVDCIVVMMSDHIHQCLAELYEGVLLLLGVLPCRF